MINIAFVHSVAKIGGAERVSQMLMEGLDKKVFQPSLVCPESGDFEQWALERNIPFMVMPIQQPGLSNLIATLKQVGQWVKWLRRNNISVIHTADPYCTRAVVIAAKLAKVKVLSHYHFPFQFNHLQWLFKGLPKPDVCAFCSEDLQNEVGTHIAKINPNIALQCIHNGVDITRFSPIDKAPSDTIHIGIVANLQERKGHDDFIDMAAILANSGEITKKHSLHFHIIGGDILEAPREPLLKEKVQQLGLADITTFHGQIPDVLAQLNQLDILVCASHQEAFPIAILEAMAMKKAIVSTNVNGIPEAIIDGESGLLVNPHQPSELADKVSLLIKDEKQRQSLAENARNRVVQHFNLTVFVKRFSDLYQSIK
ncbi:glycosyltransferase [Alteromonas sp. 5E99-2]|uniref:glycosyltransferase n=1 Tax=Alteromonas sp. 5E99-2 TaxID=2817683 RepID=UPI001A9A19FF|nr:glycosyltransferase [Alteromonas sp. 5E99-2]